MGAQKSKTQFDFVGTFSGALGDKYDIIKLLGQGAQGAAYLVKAKASGVEFVAKETHDMSAEGKQEFFDEFNKMKELHHPNCSKVFELVEGRDLIDGEWKDQLYVISELAKGSDMHNYTKKAIEAKVALTEEWISGVYKQAMQGVAYIHSKDIVHNDLKPDNILMLEEFNPKDPGRVPWVVVNDFGCATLRQDTWFKTGDPRYQSAETWTIIQKLLAGDGHNFAKVSPKADVWSMGATLYELLSGVLPFIYKALPLGEIDEAMWGTIGDAVLGAPIEIKRYCVDASPEVVDLLQDIFTKDPLKRPSANKVLEHKWFSIKGKPVAREILKKLEFNATKGLAHQILLNALVTKLRRDHYDLSWKVFQLVDKDSSGHINSDEFSAGCEKLGKDTGKAETIFKQADIDKSGEIDFTEFMAATFDWTQLAPKQLEVSLHALFVDLDRDGDGDVDISELSTLFQGVLAAKEVESIFERIDVDKDGKISQKEMKQFLFEPATQDEIDRYAIDVTKPSARRQEVCCAGFTKFF